MGAGPSSSADAVGRRVAALGSRGSSLVAIAQGGRKISSVPSRRFQSRSKKSCSHRHRLAAKTFFKSVPRQVPIAGSIHSSCTPPPCIPMRPPPRQAVLSRDRWLTAGSIHKLWVDLCHPQQGWMVGKIACAMAAGRAHGRGTQGGLDRIRTARTDSNWPNVEGLA